MGNNHDKYFGKDKRKVLMLGLPACGKTSMVEQIVQGKQANLKVQRTKDLNIRDANLQGLSVTFFVQDLAGGERQRIFWKQHYEGTQGIVFLVDLAGSQEGLKISMEQLEKLIKTEALQGIPVAICLNKSDTIQQSVLKPIQRQVSQIAKKSKIKSKIFTTNLSKPNSTREMITWLLKQTKPL